MFRANLKSWALLTLLYGILNALAAGFLGTSTDNVYNDFRPWAEKLLAGEGFGYRYPPGHVLWTAARLGLSRLLGVPYLVLSILAYIPVVILTFHGVQKLAAYVISEKQARMAAWMFFLYPLNLFSVQMDVPLPLYTLFLVFFALNLIQTAVKSWPWSGMTLSAFYLALAALIRPNPLLLPFLLAPVLYALNRGDRKYQRIPLPALVMRWLFFTVVFFLTISPWSLTASHKAGNPILLSSGFMPSHRDGLRRFHTVPFLQEEIINTRITSFSGAMGFHWQNALSHPIAYTEVWVKKTLRCWYASDSGNWEWQFGLINLFYLLPAIAGIISLVRKHPDRGSFILLLILYHWGLSIFVLSIARYQVPIMPFVCIFSVTGAVSLHGIFIRALPTRIRTMVK